MATIVSSKAGIWSDPTTWVGSVLPTTADTVTVNHVITYDLNDRSTLYGRIDINTGGAIIHDNTKPTAIQCSKYLHVNGGTYQAGPNSKTLFYTPNNSASTEGAGLAGLLVQGGTANTKLILEGSLPMPETNLTQAVNINSHVLTVADASGFSAGEYIAVYHDQKDDATWNWALDNYKNDEGFVVHHVIGNDIFIQQRVSISDTATTDLAIGGSTLKVANIKKWQTGMKVFVDNEIFTIGSIDESRSELLFTTLSLAVHNVGAKIVETGVQKVHAINDHVYKIATVLSTGSLANTNTITVANAALLNVGDRIVIEGPARYSTELEALITAKVGNVLTLDRNNTRAVGVGFIVTKTNRDCVVASTDYDTATPLDSNRCFLYYAHGSASILGRKCVMRYVEVARTGHANELYGCTIRSDFNRTDTEREIRGCSIRDGKAVARNGLWLYSAQYFPTRNNVVSKTQRGINPYDQNGGFCFNNLVIGTFNVGYAYEVQYYQSLFQYNIALNGYQPLTWSSDYNATYPEWHNIFRHFERGPYFFHTAIGQMYGSFVKNTFEDIYNRHQLAEGSRIMVQDMQITYSSDSTYNNLNTGYADYDARGLVGGMFVIVNKDFIRGNFEMHNNGGIITRDNVVQMGNGWSYQYDPNMATVDLRISQQVYVKYGVPVKVIAYMRKDAAYNGTRLPYIMARGIYQPEIFSYMANVNDQWMRVELNFTPARSEMIQIGVGGRGTAGLAWIDPRVSVSTHDLDLIQGPYSVNLMFGLDQIYQSGPSVILGGITI